MKLKIKQNIEYGSELKNEINQLDFYIVLNLLHVGTKFCKFEICTKKGIISNAAYKSYFRVVSMLEEKSY
jgi:hypothetical protein